MNWLRRWYDERPIECGVCIWTAGMTLLALALTAVSLIWG